MKKRITFIFLIILALFIIACKNNGNGGDDPKPEPKHFHIFDDVFSYDSSHHYKVCINGDCDEVSEKAEHQFVNGKCSICGYVRSADTQKFEVKFFDYDGTLLSMQSVYDGEGATDRGFSASERPDFNFIGWDKDFSKVTSNLEIYPKYQISDNVIYINYDLNGGMWGYNSKEEYILDFLFDFYTFTSPNMDLNTFIYDETGAMKGLYSDFLGGAVGSVNKLLYNNDINANNDDYFFNSSAYKEKWYNLALYVKDEICKNNRRFGTNGYDYGALDFFRYVSNDPYIYVETYGGESIFYSFPITSAHELLERYDVTDKSITLEFPSDNRFLGWYDEDGNKVESIDLNRSCEYFLTAHWKESEKYTITFDTDGGNKLNSITTEFGKLINLPNPEKEGYRFVGWYYGDTKVNSESYYFYQESITIKAKWIDKNTVLLKDLEYSSGPVRYRNSSVIVQIPEVYIEKDTEFRACWVSSYAGDYSPSTNKTQMMATLTEILDVLESFNMNAVIFHIRTHNNAFYQTKLTYIKSSFGTYESFNEWDYLTWFIGECHKRGIEFHAWLNPYRVVSSGASSLSSVTADFKDYPNNPASKEENLLMNADGGVILNPAIPEVRDFIIDICLEVMEKYEVDAIHFDDYFYISDVDDSKEMKKYNTKGLSKDDFRRSQVDLFIEELSKAMRDFNKKNNRKVQLGISPTGIYKNGNGSVESGSNTSGYAHYGSPLYADTLKWIKEEWIDYILPQSYWGFSHKSAGYADVMDWWDKAVEGSKTNLYSGIGLYMNNNDGSNYSWGSEPYEVSNQVLYTTKLANCKGVSFYKYTSLRDAYRSSSAKAHDGVVRIKNEYWTKKVSTPETIASGK